MERVTSHNLVIICPIHRIKYEVFSRILLNGQYVLLCFFFIPLSHLHYDTPHSFKISHLTIILADSSKTSYSLHFIQFLYVKLGVLNEEEIYFNQYNFN